MNKRMWPSKKKFYKSILAFRREFPEKTLEEIGQVFGLTRQRISQIVREYGNGNSFR